MKSPQRRMACRKDLKAFCTAYFPKRFKLEFSSYHLQVIKRLEDMMVQGGGKLCLAMPRASGKTCLAEVSIIWALLYGYCRYIVVVGANKPAAEKIIGNIKKNLTENKILLSDFPESVYPFHKLGGSALQARGQRYLGELTRIEWKQNYVVFAQIPGSPASGAMIYSAGINGAIRGANITMPDGSVARPDMVLLDDPQTDEVARSKTQVDKRSETIDKTIEGLVGPGEEMALFMTCTVIQEGDLSSRYLDHKEYPHWRGLRFKMVEQMPTNMKLWEQYRDIRKNEDAVKATMFYKRHRAEMREGAVVAWEANYTSESLDALQHAMNIWADKPVTFASEYQNEPMRPDQGAMVVPARVIRRRLNGLDHQTLPLDAQTLTGFIDVHDDLLYYSVVAWSDNFTGYVIDYGTYPKQIRRVFSKGETGLITMSRSDQRKDGVIQAGLTALIKELMSTHWYVEGDTVRGSACGASENIAFSKLLIDTGYKPQIVENAIRLAVGRSTVVVPAKGKSIKAVNLPMKEWKRKSGEVHGNHWIESTPPGRARTITVDTNFWKCQVHDAFRLLPGTPGSLTLWGRDSETHRMFSEHMNAEVAKLVESGGNSLYEWQDTPNDNHFFDCIVGSMIAASRLGIKSAEEKIERPKRKRASL